MTSYIKDVGSFNERLNFIPIRETVKIWELRSSITTYIVDYSDLRM